MSFSGFYQILCENGHYCIQDAWFNEENFVCPFCKSTKIAWINGVDQTNECTRECDLLEKEKDICCKYGCGYREFEEILPQKNEVCPTCGHFLRVIQERTFKIPRSRGSQQTFSKDEILEISNKSISLGFIRIDREPNMLDIYEKTCDISGDLLITNQTSYIIISDFLNGISPFDVVLEEYTVRDIMITEYKGTVCGIECKFLARSLEKKDV